MSRRKLGIRLFLVVVFVVLGAAATLRDVEEVTFSYTTMPPNDDELRRWVADQTRFASAKISRVPAGVHVRYSEPLWVKAWRGGSITGDFKDLMAACEQTGYKGFRGFQGRSYVSWSK
jgi:hypothetical protein